MLASCWSKTVFQLKNDTDMVERLRIAQNSSMTLIFRKNKKKCPKMDILASRVLNFKSHLNHTIWGSFESSWALVNGKNNEKNCVQKRHLVAMWLKFKKSPKKGKMGLNQKLVGSKRRENIKKFFQK